MRGATASYFAYLWQPFWVPLIEDYAQRVSNAFHGSQAANQLGGTDHSLSTNGLSIRRDETRETERERELRETKMANGFSSIPLFRRSVNCGLKCAKLSFPYRDPRILTAICVCAVSQLE